MRKILLLIASALALAPLLLPAAVMVKAKMWPQGSKLNIVFLDGDAVKQRLVRETALLWVDNTNLSFTFYSSLKVAPKLTHIRISFDLHTGTTLGNHGDYFSLEPTMGLDALNQPDNREEQIKRIILHEFGHALGLEHEFLSPYWPHNGAELERFLMDCRKQALSIGYDRAKAELHCQQLNTRITHSDAKTTIFDEFSVMNYPQTVINQLGEKRFVSARYQLSILDKSAIQRWYPVLSP